MKDIRVRDIVEKLLKSPQDAIVCNEIDGEYFSIEGILEYTEGDYMDSVGEEKEGNLIIIK